MVAEEWLECLEEQRSRLEASTLIHSGEKLFFRELHHFYLAWAFFREFHHSNLKLSTFVTFNICTFFIRWGMVKSIGLFALGIYLARYYLLHCTILYWIVYVNFDVIMITSMNILVVYTFFIKWPSQGSKGDQHWWSAFACLVSVLTRLP